MNETVMRRTWEWRTFVWAGVVGSVLAWTWVWFAGRGASVVMLLVAFAAVALAMRATAGMRLALVGLMVAGLVMFLASLYWLTLVLFAGNGVNAVDVLTTAVPDGCRDPAAPGLGRRLPPRQDGSDQDDDGLSARLTGGNRLPSTTALSQPHGLMLSRPTVQALLSGRSWVL